MLTAQIQTLNVVFPRSVVQEIRNWRPEAIQTWVADTVDLPHGARIIRKEIIRPDLANAASVVRLVYIVITDA